MENDISDFGMMVPLLPELTEEQMELLQKAAEEMEAQKRAMYEQLAGEVQSKFEVCSQRRQSKEREWIEAMRLKLAGLSGDRHHGTKLNPVEGLEVSKRPGLNLVKTKLDIAIAQGISLQFAGGDKNWDILPTRVAEGVNDQREADLAAEAMEDEIEDQLTETRYGAKMRQAYDDRVTLGTGIIKGPLPAREAKLTYESVPSEDGSMITIPIYKMEDKPVLFRVDPWMFFPDDTVHCIDDAQYAIELHPMSKVQLMKLKKNPGFFAEAIDELCRLEPQEYQNTTFTEYSALTDSAENIFKGKYAVLEYHGPISVDHLGVFGIEPSYPPLGDTYFGEVWVCQGQILRVELEAISGSFELPYAVSPWMKDPGSIFGFGLPMIMRDTQQVAQAAWLMIQDNSSISSGPIAVINTNVVEPMDGSWDLRPHKILKVNDYGINDVKQVLDFIQVPNVVGDLMVVLNEADRRAEMESGIPMIAAGLNSTKIGTDSATGLAIQEQQSTVVNDFYGEQWDDDITEKVIRRMYHWNMQYNPKQEIKGDFEIDVRSATQYRKNQMQARELEKLSVETGQNPMVASVINPKELQRARLSLMHLPSKTIVKSAQQIAAEEAEAAQNPPPPDPQMLKAQADMMRMEIDRERLELEKAKLQFEMTQAQQREIMDHQERLMATQARFEEAKARVFEAQSEERVKMMELAMKYEGEKGWIIAELQKSAMGVEKDKFIAGMDARVKAQEMELTREEMEIKRKQGTGI